MIEITIQALQQIFNVKNQKLVAKGLYYKVCLMNHIMHTNNKWKILLLDMDYHPKSQALKGANPIKNKTNQP
jgi:hypothetical protein